MFSQYDTVLFIPSEKELNKIFNVSKIELYKHFKYSFVNNIPIIITGIGKTNTSITTSLFFNMFKPKKSILTGICGTYRISNLKIGDIVSIKYDFFVDEASYDGDNLLLLKDKFSDIYSDDIQFNTINDFNVVNSNTVSLIPTCDNLSQIYQKKTNALVENMEGASFCQVANMFNITSYQIRGISNFCGKNQEWDIKKACKNIKNAILSII